MRITRRHLIPLGSAAILAVPAAAHAVVAPPPAPVLVPVPPVVAAGSGLGWTPVTFAPGLTGPGYRVDLASPTAPALGADLAGAGTSSFAVPGTAVDGATYTLSVRATANEASSTAAASTPFLYDARPPTGTVRIDAGAPYTTGLTVTLHFAATDPTPGAGEVGAIDFTEGDFPCADPLACHRSYVTGVQKYLAAGPDGIRTISARFYDTAVRAGKGPSEVDGNVSQIVTDTIFLDRRAPTARLTASAAAVAPGVPVRFDSAGSIDGVEGPTDSGLSDEMEWDFGDGATATGATATHAWASAGVRTVTLRVRDRAGLAGTATTTVTVGTPGATAALPRVTGLRVLGAPRAGTPMRVGIRMRGRGVVTLRLLPSGRAAALRTVRRAAGPGHVTMTLRAPRAGHYRLRATAGGHTMTIPVVVQPPVRAVTPR